MELLLSSELWRLKGRVQLPRLLRLVCQQLAASCTAQRRAAEWASLWLKRIWRPLALLCRLYRVVSAGLRAGLEFVEEPQLVELLQATSFAPSAERPRV